MHIFQVSANGLTAFCYKSVSSFMELISYKCMLRWFTILIQFLKELLQKVCFKYQPKYWSFDEKY